jgi:branched-chain amino acid transport system substrate-binding protein
MDHASMPERVLTYYKNFRDFHNGYLVLGWGVLSSSLLDRHVNRDHVVYMSADLNPKRADPAEAPYCFFIGATYEDQARLAMQWVKVNGGGKVVFIYPRIPFGECPIPGGKEQAERLGLTVGPDLYMDLRATDASSQVKRLKEIEADYAWVGGTSPATEALIKQAAAKGLSTRFIINSWGLDERAAKRLGEFALGRVYGFCPVRPFAWDAPALDWIKSVSDAENLTLHYNQAWASMLVLWEGLKRAAPEDLDGPGLKAALETLEGFETGGLAPPVTFTPRDHRSARVCGLYTIQQGRLKLVLDVGFDAEGLARARQAPSPAQAAAGVAGD